MDVVEDFKYLLNSDISNLSKNKQIKYFEELETKINEVMDNKDIDLDIFEKLLNVKKQIMSKIYNLKR